MPENASRRRHGSGSITLRSGVYYGRWRIGDRQVQRRIGPRRGRAEPDGLTQAQAEVRLRELMATSVAEEKQRVSKRPAHARLTIAELGRRYVEYGRDHKGLKASTLTDYESHVRIHLAPYFGSRAVDQIDARAVEAFHEHLRRKPGSGRRGGKRLSSKTVANVVGTLAVLLNFALKKKWIDVTPMAAADLARPSSDAPLQELRFLEPSEVDGLIEAARPGRYELLDRALYTLAAYTGLRQGELRGLKWEHVDLDRSIVHVLENVTRRRRSSPKGKRRRRVPLAPTAAVAVRRLRAGSEWARPHQPVFATPATGDPMALTPLMTRYRMALAAAGLPNDFSFHDLRHTFGTTMARAGVPVTTIQAWMGHADLETTQIYMHYAPAETDANQIDAAFRSGTL